MSVLSPNMNLVVSTIGVDSGLNWEQNLNASLTIIDGHNHTSGNGTLIPPSGLNINTDLPFNSNSATNIKSVVFTNQSSLATLNSLYTVAGDLYYNDPTGAIQITLGGAVNATSSGISSGAASAAFSTGVLVVNAAANTPANIQVGSVLLGNNVAASKFLTLAPPAAMAANFTLTLPSIPAAQQFISLDTSGNISGYTNVSGGLTTANLSSTAGITGSQIASGTITTTQISSTAGIVGGQLAAATVTADKMAATTLSSGLYTPAASAASAITIIAVPQFQYARVSGVVTVSGTMTVNIASGSAFSFKLTTPVSSGSYSASNQAGGTAFATTSGIGAGISATVSAQTITVSGAGGTAGTSETLCVHFTYQVI